MIQNILVEWVSPRLDKNQRVLWLLSIQLSLSLYESRPQMLRLYRLGSLNGMTSTRIQDRQGLDLHFVVEQELSGKKIIVEY